MEKNAEKERCQVAVYYFPNWHPCPSNERVYGKGESEWLVVRNARPRFQGHKQPKIPLWGYEDESDPAVMEKKLAVAADHAIDVFIFDWYWSDAGPALQAALENGYLKADNNDRVKFSCMWANHQQVSREAFDQAVDHVVETYFSHPSYWTIDGRPYFSIYEFNTLVAGLGSVDETRQALDYLREKTVKAGFPGLHLNAVEWGIQKLPEGIADRNELVARMGIDSVTSYVWIHNVTQLDFPENAYADVVEKACADWERFTEEFKAPYHPNVTMGWDSWPRVPSTEPFEPAQYPRTPLITSNLPEEFQKALQRAKSFFETQGIKQRILTINAWNEWTEGSYLEPDTEHGMAYLEAIRVVFERG